MSNSRVARVMFLYILTFYDQKDVKAIENDLEKPKKKVQIMGLKRKKQESGIFIFSQLF